LYEGRNEHGGCDGGGGVHCLLVLPGRGGEPFGGEVAGCYYGCVYLGFFCEERLGEVLAAGGAGEVDGGNPVDVGPGGRRGWGRGAGGAVHGVGGVGGVAL